MQLKDMISTMVRESISEKFASEIESRTTVNESVVGIVAAIGLAVSAMGAVVAQVRAVQKNRWIKEQLDKDIPRLEHRLNTIIRSIKMAANSRDISTAEASIESLRKDVHEAQVKSMSMSADKISIDQKTVTLNPERRKEDYIKSYQKTLVDFEKTLNTAVDTAYRHLDDVIQGDVGSKAVAI